MSELGLLETPPMPSRMYCWDCKSRPREVIFLPDDRGSFLSCKCSVCAKAPGVLARLEEAR